MTRGSSGRLLSQVERNAIASFHRICISAARLVDKLNVLETVQYEYSHITHSPSHLHAGAQVGFLSRLDVVQPSITSTGVLNIGLNLV